MKNEDKSKEQLMNELIEMRRRVVEVAVSQDKKEPHKNLLWPSENLFRYLVENANDIVYSLTADGIFTYVSPAWTEILGHDIRDVVGQSIGAFVHPEDIPLCRAFLEQVVATGEKQAGVEYRVRHKTGAWRWHTTNASPIRQADGKIVSYVGIARDVTDRRCAEESLRYSEKLYRSVIDNIKDTFYRADTAGKLIIISPSGTTLLGYDTVEEMIGLDIANSIYVNPEDRKNILSAIAERGFVTDFEVKLRRRDGAPVDVSTSSHRYFDENGTILGIEGVLRDITERKQTENKLRDSEAKFHALAESSPSAIFLIQNTKYIYINQAFESMVGYTMDDLADMNFWDIVHPDFREMVKNRGLSRLNGERQPSRYEIKFITKNGHERWMDFAATAIEFENKPTILGSTFDITERKRAEEALRESEDKFRVLTEKAVVGVYLIRDGVFQYVNPKAADILGYPEDEIVMKVATDFVVPEDLPMVRAYFRRRISGEVDSLRYELRMIKKSGDVIFVEVYGSRIVYNGQAAIIGTLLDISDRKRAEEEARHREKLQGILEMAGAICHEMNQPMQIISGYSDLLLMTISENDPIHGKLDTIIKQIHRMGTITRKLMTIKDYETQDYAGISRIVDINKSSGKDIE